MISSEQCVLDAGYRISGAQEGSFIARGICNFTVRPFVVLHDLVCVTPAIPAILGSCVDGNEGPS